MTAKPDYRFANGFALVAAVAALLSIGAALYERAAARRAEAAEFEASHRYAAAQRELQARSRPRPTAGPSDGPRTAEDGPAGAVAGAAPAAVGSRPKRSAAEQKAEWQRFLAVHPEVHDLLLAVGRHQFEVIFAGFFKSAGFTSAQVDQLEAASMDTWLAGFALGPQGDVRATAGILPSADLLRGILGTQGAQEMQDYNRTMPALGIVNQIAAKAGLASEPLSPEQATQLAQLVTANSAAYAAGKRVDVAAVDWGATLTQIGGLLSPAQAQAAERVILPLQYQAALQQARQAAAGNSP